MVLTDIVRASAVQCYYPKKTWIVITSTEYHNMIAITAGTRLSIQSTHTLHNLFILADVIRPIVTKSYHSQFRRGAPLLLTLYNRK